MEAKPNTGRIAWIDVAKFLGMFAIYLGHFGNFAGKAYQYVFTFHVPLFFLISGGLASCDKETDVKAYFIKKFKTILAPFYVFVLLSIATAVIEQNIGVMQVVEMLRGG